MQPNANDVKIIRTTSAFDCGGRCPLKLHVKDNKIIRIEGDDIPDRDEQLRTCLRCRAIRKEVHHPDRLKYPMKRVGPKGKGEFERISWDEAYDTIIDKLNYTKDKFGNESIFLAPGGGYLGALHSGGRALAVLLARFGGYSTNYGNVSSEGAVWAVMAQYGSVMVGHTRDDLLNSKLIIMWGWDPVRMISGTNTIYHLIKAKEAGIKIICIDPRYHDSAATLADQWIPIKPGTDTAMMSAMANVIINENLHDQSFLDKYTLGFDADHMPDGADVKENYRDYVLGTYDGVPKTPEWAEKITSVPASVIRDLAIEYASAKPAALMDCQGPARSAMGEQYNRAAMTLCALTGNVGKNGGSAGGGLMGIPVGHMFRSSGIPGMKNPVETGGPSIRGTLDLRLRTARRIHTNKMFDAILKGKSGGYPFDIKMAWFVCNNFLNQLGNTNKAARALTQLDFMVVNELFMTPTARYADILLPVTHVAERNDLTRPWPSGLYYTHVNKAVDPPGECKSDFDIICELAQRMGYDDFNPATEDQWLRAFVEKNPETGPQIKDYDKFRKEGIYRVKLPEPIVAFKDQINDPEKHPFETPSGKIEIYSQRAADLKTPLCPAVPKYVPTWEDQFDPLSKKFPLQVLTPHGKTRVHSHLGNIDWLKEVEPHRAWINPVDADARGIKDGDEIYVYNDRGKIAITAWVTERIIPGVVCVFEGTWYDPDDEGICRGGCANVLTNDEYSTGGASALNTLLVDICKAS